MQSPASAAALPASRAHAAPASHFHAAKINLPRFGMLTFLASEAMLFAGLICAYVVLRTSMGHGYHPPGAPDLPWKLTLLNTAFLVASSFTCIFAERQVVRGIRPTMWLAVTTALGALFVAIQGREWTHLYHEGLWFDTSGVYGSVFFVLTGFHGCHVAIGVLMLGICTLMSFFGKFTAHHHTALECTALYWHFVDVVWLFLFTILYLV